MMKKLKVLLLQRDEDEFLKLESFGLRIKAHDTTTILAETDEMLFDFERALKRIDGRVVKLITLWASAPRYVSRDS